MTNVLEDGLNPTVRRIAHSAYHPILTLYWNVIIVRDWINPRQRTMKV